MSESEQGEVGESVLEQQILHQLARTAFFGSGRAALSAILDDAIARYGIGSISLPSYCCDSVVASVAKRNLSVEFYPVTANVGVGIHADLQDCSTDAVVLIDYFGLCDSLSFGLSPDQRIVIRDLTHSFFNPACLDDSQYCFGSLRKWAGFYTGGIAWGNGFSIYPSYQQDNQEYVLLRKKAMEEKRLYIEGTSKSKEYLDLFKKADDTLCEAAVNRATDEDIKRLIDLDYAFIRETRRHNYQVLLDSLGSIALFEGCDSDCTPLFFPIIVNPSERDALRDYLKSNEIYCPVHWPAPSNYLKELSPLLYSSELSIICDQRYNEQDMLRISETLLSFWD